MDWAAVYVVAVIFFATLVRSTFGFGEALVAVPLLALRVPMGISVPLAVALSATVAGVVVVQDWRRIHLASASWMVLATLFGIPLGVFMLTRINSQAAKIVLGVIIALFAIYSLVGRGTLHLKNDSRAGLLISGFFAGVLGGAYGLNGPPLVIYAAMRRWSAQHFRATLQAYFLPASAITLVGYAVTGLITGVVVRYYLLSLLPAFIAILLGRAINHRLHGESFLRYVYAGLLGIGVLLLAQGIFHF
ncbi:MAG TPA: sulfite exporter TauE/SafE family protein [Tepidisphaeraceae bacterium]|jgi:hypothetical protein|nr:sulfite exporter TauE/SafE family protein [Tepidisphaeraceae bacterium]